MGPVRTPRKKSAFALSLESLALNCGLQAFSLTPGALSLKLLALGFTPLAYSLA